MPIARVVCVLAVMILPPAESTRLAAADSAGDRISDLTDRLTTGLRVRAPADVAFCERVTTLVREGRLPESLVDSTYTWAIKRGKKHPFPAFQHVIRLQATKLGVPL